MTGIVEELDNGIVVHQTTDEAAIKSNIYCEFPWCPPSSRWFVYVRHAPEHAPNSQEYVACEFGSWEKRVLGRAAGVTMAGGRFYFRKVTPEGQGELIRMDLDNGSTAAFPLPPAVPRRSYLAIRDDERYVAYNIPPSFQPQLFGIGLADLRTGQCETICTDPSLCNTHLQFEPGQGRHLLVQHNRGCVFTPEGKLKRLVGDEGATLFILEIPGGRILPLQVGPPYTAGISGHETWIGHTGEVILTSNVQDDYDHGKGPILAVRPGSPAREIAPPWQMNHIGMEPSGRIFCADTFAPDEIIIGSPRTNRSAVVCAARTSYKRALMDTHPHAYISPDCRWVVFNSDRTGVPQIYAAAIPPDWIARLDR